MDTKEIVRAIDIKVKRGLDSRYIFLGSRLIGVDLKDLSCSFGSDGGELLLQRGLSCLKKKEEDLVSDLKGAPWKVVLASWIKSQCGVSNQWLNEHLHVGHPSNISRMIAIETNDLRPHKKLWKKLRTTR